MIMTTEFRQLAPLTAELEILPSSMGPLEASFLGMLHGGIEMWELLLNSRLSEYWLSLNSANRRIDETRTSQYTRDKRAREWRDYVGEPFAFDQDGNMVSGGHRSLATIRSGVPSRILLLVGVPTRDRLVMDSGKPRSLSNQLQLLGKKNYSHLSSVIIACWQYETGRGVGRGTTPTKSESVTWLEANPEVEESVRVGMRLNSHLPLGVLALSAVHYIQSRVDQDDADEFFNRLAPGVALEEGDPILALRSWVAGWAQRRDKPSSTIKAHALMKTCNLWRAGKLAKLIKVRPGEEFPRAWGEE